MSSASILHVGDDVCRRIPVLTRAGYDVLCSEDSTPAIRAVFGDGDSFSAILFNCDLAPPADSMVQAVRSLSTAPLVLFQNPTVACEDGDFDLVVPVLTPPDIWLKKLRDLIQEAQHLHEQALQLRADCESVRSQSRALRESAARNREISFDREKPWRGKSDNSSGSS